MATFSGVGGTVTLLSQACLNVRGWSITESAAVAVGGHSSCTASAHSTQKFKEAVAGTKSWEGSFTFYQDDTQMQPEKASVSYPLDAGEAGALSVSDGTNTYAGNIVVTSVTWENDIEGGGIVSGTCAFTGAGALTIS